MEALTCGCEPAEKGLGYNPSNCLIHGPGGLREMQAQRRLAWEKAHPVRHAIMQLEYSIRRWWWTRGKSSKA